MTANRIDEAYRIAKERYAEYGVDVEEALKKLAARSISVHCWQGDDVGGFERPDAELSGGGIQVTGNFPGKARTIPELRQDFEKVYSLLPGNHRLNLHAIYGEFGGKEVDRDAIGPEHFTGWIDWAKANDLKLDFNATCFSHAKADDGFTLSSKDPGIRSFWIEHSKRCRTISAEMGRALGSPCIHNLWIPDGTKDACVDRWAHRALLKESLDSIYEEDLDPAHMKDAVESKLFGIGSEAYVVGSHDFYFGYALTSGKILCIDMGHYHPTESVGDKLSAVLQYTDELLLHVSRGVRWDSDHVVILNDQMRELTQEVVRCDPSKTIHIALDFFDGSINRVGAYVVGTRATLQSMLFAMLEPLAMLREAEEAGNDFKRLALLEESKLLPSGAVWEYYCQTANVPVGQALIDEIMTYENDVIRKRD